MATPATTSKPNLLRRLNPARFLRRPNNIFGVLIIVAGVAIMLRLVNVATFALSMNAEENGSGVTRSATAEDTPAPVQAVDADAPAITPAELERAATATAAPAATATAAPAAATSNAAAPPTPAVATEETDKAPPPAAAFAPTDGREYSNTELEILQSLSKRREELDLRERNLSESAALLKAAEQEVDRKLSELNSLKAEIEKLLGTQEKVEEQRIASLVKIYEAMKPKEAATIFNTLDPDVLLSVVSRMNERRLSPILASMDPEKARMVTIRLAEQRQLPGAAEPEPADPFAFGAPGAPSPAADNALESPVLNLPEPMAAEPAAP